MYSPQKCVCLPKPFWEKCGGMWPGMLCAAGAPATLPCAHPGNSLLWSSLTKKMEICGNQDVVLSLETCEFFLFLNTKAVGILLWNCSCRIGADSCFYLTLERWDTICPVKQLLEGGFPNRELTTKSAGPSLQIPLEDFWLMVFSQWQDEAALPWQQWWGSLFPLLWHMAVPSKVLQLPTHHTSDSFLLQTLAGIFLFDP